MKIMTRYIRENMNNSKNVPIVDIAYSRLGEYLKFKENGEEQLIDLLLSVFKGFKHTHGGALAEEVIEQHSDKFKDFADGYDFESEEWKKNYETNIKVYIGNICVDNPELDELIKTPARERNLYKKYIEDERLAEQYKATYLSEFPNVNTLEPSNIAHKYIEEGMKKDYELLKQDEDTVKYLIHDKKLKDKRQIKKIRDTYKKISERNSQYRGFNSDVLDTLISYDWKKLSANKMVQEFEKNGISVQNNSQFNSNLDTEQDILDFIKSLTTNGKEIERTFTSFKLMEGLFLFNPNGKQKLIQYILDSNVTNFRSPQEFVLSYLNNNAHQFIVFAKGFNTSSKVWKERYERDLIEAMNLALQSSDVLQTYLRDFKNREMMLLKYKSDNVLYRKYANHLKNNFPVLNDDRNRQLLADVLIAENKNDVFEIDDSYSQLVKYLNVNNIGSKEKFERILELFSKLENNYQLRQGYIENLSELLVTVANPNQSLEQNYQILISNHLDDIKQFSSGYNTYSLEWKPFFEKCLVASVNDLKKNDSEINVYKVTQRYLNDTQLLELFNNEAKRTFPTPDENHLVEVIMEYISNKLEIIEGDSFRKEIVSYLINDRGIKNKHQIKSIIDSYGKLITVDSKYSKLNKKALDTLISYDFTQLNSNEMAKKYLNSLKGITETEESEEDKKLAIYTFNQVKSLVTQLKPMYTQLDLTIYRNIVKYIESNFDKSVKENIMFNQNDLVIVIKTDEVTYYINPYFMISDWNRKVWLDFTDSLSFPKRAITLQTDKEYEKHLKEFYNMISSRKRKSRKQLKLTEQDMKRFERLREFGKQETLDKFGITSINTRFSDTPKNAHLKIQLKENSSVVFIMTPHIFGLWNGNIIHSLQSGESNYVAFVENFKKIKSSMSKEAFNDINKLAMYSFDLRRKL